MRCRRSKAGWPACWARTGLLVLGTDLEQAQALTIEVENLCEMYWRALQIGEPALLSDAEMALVLEKFRHYGANAQS